MVKVSEEQKGFLKTLAVVAVLCTIAYCALPAPGGKKSVPEPEDDGSTALLAGPAPRPTPVEAEAPVEGKVKDTCRELTILNHAVLILYGATWEKVGEKSEPYHHFAYFLPKPPYEENHHFWILRKPLGFEPKGYEPQSGDPFRLVKLVCQPSGKEWYRFIKMEN